MSKFSLILLLAALAPVAMPFQSAARQYISPDHSFELTVPPAYNVHTGPNKPPISYIPICQDESLVCITYPQGRYPGSTFGGASLQVTRLPDKTAQTCLDPRKTNTADDDSFFQFDAKRPSRVIDGVRFLHGFFGAGAMSHYVASNSYRGYKNGGCYELSVSVASTNYSVYSPGAIKEFTKQDQERVTAQLTRILDSFHTPPRASVPDADPRAKSTEK